MTLSRYNDRDPVNRFSNAPKFIRVINGKNATVSLHIWVVSILEHLKMVQTLFIMFECCSWIFFFRRMCLQTDRRHQDKHKLLYMSNHGVKAQ